MKFPSFLIKNAHIGVTSPSLSCDEAPYLARTKASIEKFTNLGYKVTLTDGVYKKNIKGEGSNAKTRAKELMDLYFDDNIDFIFSNGGGERMIEILPYLNFEKLKESKPKFFMGFSDNTNFSFTLTTICDVASIYGEHFPRFCLNDPSINDALNVIQGNKDTQVNYPKYEIESLSNIEGHYLDNYNCTKDTNIINLTGEEEINMQGRIIGGCLDVLISLCGTKFDKVKEFTEKYKNDGIIWYFEACELNPMGVLRALFQLKNAEWFSSSTKGFIFGRPLNANTYFELTHQEAILEILKELNVPIIFGADIGHVPPVMTIINGAYATINSKNNKLTIKQELK